LGFEKAKLKYAHHQQNYIHLPPIITKLTDSPLEGETNPLGMVDVGSVIDLRYPKLATNGDRF